MILTKEQEWRRSTGLNWMYVECRKRWEPTRIRSHPPRVQVELWGVPGWFASVEANELENEIEKPASQPGKAASGKSARRL